VLRLDCATFNKPLTQPLAVKEMKKKGWRERESPGGVQWKRHVAHTTARVARRRSKFWSEKNNYPEVMGGMGGKWERRQC